jgi:hypothetical protein
MKKGGVFDLK